MIATMTLPHLVLAKTKDSSFGSRAKTMSRGISHWKRHKSIICSTKRMFFTPGCQKSQTNLMPARPNSPTGCMRAGKISSGINLIAELHSRSVFSISDTINHKKAKKIIHSKHPKTFSSKRNQNSNPSNLTISYRPSVFQQISVS